MQNNRRKKRANEFVISIAMHLALFGLLIWSSLYQTVEIMGGGEGEGDAMGAVMVDTGSAAQEWGRIQQQKKGQTDKQKKPEPVVEEKNQSLNLNQISKKLRNKKRLSVSRKFNVKKNLKNKSSKKLKSKSKNSSKSLLVKRR